MTRHALDVKHYISPETFSRESKNLFSKFWIFAGFSSMVRERNQFFTRTIAGIPVLIQRTKAGIRAFANECPHRLSAIQTEVAGKRPMVCPYHAWSFDDEGSLVGIPNEGLYQFSDKEREHICLRKFHLEEVGQLLFVNLSDTPVPITEQFSESFLDGLHAVSAHLDHKIIYSCHRVKYNWKLNMENVKDYNHVPFIHAKTFAPIMATPTKNITRLNDKPSVVKDLIQKNIAPDLASLSYATKAPIQQYNNWFSNLCNGYGEKDAYYNWFIYPNVNFCSVKGEHFLLQQYEPVSPGETDYHLWMMTASRKDERTDFTALLSALIRSERFVIAEDTLVLEKLQAGFNENSSKFMHGDYEVRLVQQHLWYRKNVLGEVV